MTTKRDHPIHRLPDDLENMAGILDALEQCFSGVKDDLWGLIPADRKDEASRACWTDFIFTERLRDEAARLREYATTLRTHLGGRR